MKQTIRTLIFIAILAVFGFSMISCATLLPQDDSEKINNVEELKAYLESQPANSPDTPLKITVKNINSSSAIKDVADILRSTDKYVSIILDGSAFALGLIKVEDSVFRDCKSLINMELGRFITNIGNDAFRGCTNLVSLTLPYNLSEFSNTAHTALDDCPSLTAIDASSSELYSSYQGVLYNKDKTLLIFCPQGKTGNYTIPDSVWDIAPYAFYGSKLSGITMTGGSGLNLQKGRMEIFTIGNNAFINCNNLTSVTIKGEADFNGKAFDGNFQEVYDSSALVTMRDGSRGRMLDMLGGTYTRETGSDKWTGFLFPSGFEGKWKRDTFNNTLTFNQKSFRDSSQDGYSCVLQSISGDSYTCRWSSGREFTLTFRLVNGNLVIEGDSGTDQRNWNGTWTKQ